MVNYNSEYVKGAAEAICERIREELGETVEERKRIRCLNNTLLFYIESMLKEVEWVIGHVEKQPPFEPEPALKTAEQKNHLGHAARIFLEGMRFLEDYMRGNVNGKYDCHDLSVLAQVTHFDLGCYGGARVPQQIVSEAKALAAEAPSDRSSAKYARFIRKKSDLERKIIEEFLEDMKED